LLLKSGEQQGLVSAQSSVHSGTHPTGTAGPLQSHFLRDESIVSELN